MFVRNWENEGSRRVRGGGGYWGYGSKKKKTPQSLLLGLND